MAGRSEKQLPSAPMFRTLVMLGQRGREPPPHLPTRDSEESGLLSLHQSSAGPRRRDRSHTRGPGHAVGAVAETLARLPPGPDP